MGDKIKFVTDLTPHETGSAGSSDAPGQDQEAAGSARSGGQRTSGAAVTARAGQPSIAYGVTSASAVGRLGRRTASQGLRRGNGANGAADDAGRGASGSSGAHGAGLREDFLRPERRDRPPHHRALRPGARQETLRESNLLLITQEIFSAVEPLSRADLSIRTGMTRSTVSRLVDDLLLAGIVREGSPIVGGTRGRPAVPLLPARSTLAGLGVEVNVDFMAARALDLTGEVLAEEIVEGDFRGSDPFEVLPRTGEMARRVAARVEAAGAVVVGTVLGLPGLVSDDADRLLLAPNMGWRDIDVVALLCAGKADEAGGTGESGGREPADGTAEPSGSAQAVRALSAGPVPGLGGFVMIANEAKLAALAVAQELTVLEGQEQTFLYVSAQMGIGAAVVIDGVVDAGPRGWAGEIGHISVEPGGPQCGCGATGCLEVFAGKRALLAEAGLDPTASAEELVALTEWEDEPGERARQAIDRAGWALGIALSGAANLLDVEEVVLGGEFGPLADLLRPRIQAELSRRVLASAWSRFRVRETDTGVAPAATGGALRVLCTVLDAPVEWIPAETLVP